MQSDKALYREYDAKGWPSIDPSSREYCYQPCRFGLHVCGHHPDGMNCLTIANLEVATEAAALDLFARAKAELASTETDADFVVDLQINDEHTDDFMMHRQMLDRLIAMGATNG